VEKEIRREPLQYRPKRRKEIECSNKSVKWKWVVGGQEGYELDIERWTHLPLMHRVRNKPF